MYTQIEQSFIAAVTAAREGEISVVEALIALDPPRGAAGYAYVVNLAFCAGVYSTLGAARACISRAWKEAGYPRIRRAGAGRKAKAVDPDAEFRSALEKRFGDNLAEALTFIKNLIDAATKAA